MAGATGLADRLAAPRGVEEPGAAEVWGLWEAPEALSPGRHTLVFDFAYEGAGLVGLARGDLMFVIQTPPDFDRAIDRGESPGVLIDADATDPTAIGNAVAALG